MRSAEEWLERVRAAEYDPDASVADVIAAAQAEAGLDAETRLRAEMFAVIDREKLAWKAKARREALAMDQPWSVPDVLAKLADAADHLLSVHDCDHLHYERVYAARDAARGYLAALAAKEGR